MPLSQLTPVNPGWQAHWYWFTWSMQMPPLTQGSDAHSSISCSQMSPVHPGEQAHWYPFTWSMHWPLEQGLDSHSSISFSQLSPVNPGRHWQVYRLSPSTHSPLFRQGSDRHSSMLILQLPFAGSQVWPAGHTTGGATQLPVTGSQALTVQLSPSVQIFGVFAQPVAGLQLSVVQRLLSLQLTGG